MASTDKTVHVQPSNGIVIVMVQTAVHEAPPAGRRIEVLGGRHQERTLALRTTGYRAAFSDY